MRDLDPIDRRVRVPLCSVAVCHAPLRADGTCPGCERRVEVARINEKDRQRRADQARKAARLQRSVGSWATFGANPPRSEKPNTAWGK